MLNARMFNISAGAAVAIIALFSTLLFSTQQAFPFYIGNAGTFLIGASSMQVDGFELTLGVDENSSESGGGLPTGELSIGSVVIQDMLLEKEFNVASVIGNIAQPQWKLRMTSDSPVNLDGAIINAVGICGETFDAQGLTADASGANTADFTDDFTLRANSVSMTNAGIQAGFLSTNSISLRNLQLSVTPGGYDKPACLP